MGRNSTYQSLGDVTMSEYNPDYWDDDDLFYPWNDVDDISEDLVWELDREGAGLFLGDIGELFRAT